MVIFARTRAPRSTALLFALLSVSVISARAAPITLLVGADGGAACDFNNLQDAINAAGSNTGPDMDTIRVAMNATYTAQALKISNQPLTIIGGYASCASPMTTPGARTTISGLGGAADSVIEVLTSTAGNLRFENLIIRDGDEGGDSGGGGIDFQSQGSLTLNNVIVANNRSGYGGGIYFEGANGPSTLTFGPDTVIQNNTSQNSGGGVRVSGDALFHMLGERSTVTGNEAQGLASNTGYGGGVQIVPPAKAEIASPGLVNFGAISNNRAKYGGGLAITAPASDETDGRVVLYTVDAQRPVRIDHNVASIAGGGVYLDPDLPEDAVLCGYEFRIDHNQAPDGAALYLDNYTSLGISRGAFVYFNRTADGCAQPAPSSMCAKGILCNSIDSNIVAEANGQAADGAIIEVTEQAFLKANRVALVANRGSDVIHTLTSDVLDLRNILIADNVLTARAIASDAAANLLNLTIAGNTQGFNDVLRMTNTITLRNSIIWQPGKQSLGNPHGTLDGGSVLTNDPASLPIPGAFNLDPRFADPGRGDYRLRAASPGIDVTMPETDPLDLDGLPRQQELPMNNGFGPRDLGAYERQALLPLVLNASFNVDTAHWFNVTAGVSAFDATQNAPGSPPGGAMNFNWENTPVAQARVVSRAHCIHLPLPGTYRLNGFARTTGGTAVSGQAARLQWELRRDGTEACTAGAANAQGDLTLATGTAWTPAANPAAITISPLEFTRNSSITVSLVMVATGVTFPPGMHGWFDDVSLTLDTDALFSDGFE